MFKNVATSVVLFAFDTTTGAAKTGDAANITPYVSKDYGTVTALGTATATEIDSTNAKGWYKFTVAQAETNADALLFTAKSSTANVAIVGQYIFTTPPNFTATSIDSSGVVKANLAQILGTALTETAGQIAAAFKKFFNIATPASTMDHLTLVDTVTTATTATNLTNAPTAGDFTAAMKSSLNAATPAVTVSDKTGFALTSAYDAAKTAAQAGDAMALTSGERTTLAAAIWNALTSGMTTVGSIGKRLVDNIDAAISTRSTYAGADTAGTTTLLSRLTSTRAGLLDHLDADVSTRLAATDYTAPPTAAENADAVLDEALSGHTTAGSAGAALTAAGSAGDPWSTPLPGAYGAGTAGKIIGDNLDVAVSTRSSHSAADVWAVGTRTLTSFGTLVADVATAVWAATTRLLTAGTNIVLAKGTGITGLNDLDAVGVRGAIGMAAADLDDQLGTMNTGVGVAAAASASAATAAAAIKLKTDNLPAAPAAVGDIPTAAQNADKLLGRNIAGGSDGGRTVTEALRPLRNKTFIDVDGVLHVMEEDDTTASWTALVTRTAGDPLSAVDPA